MNKALKAGAILLVLAAAGLGLAWMDLTSKIAPTQLKAEPIYVRIEAQTSVAQAFDSLEEKGVLRDSGAALFFAKLKRLSPAVREGTFEFKGGETVEQVVAMLRRPMRRMIRIPEGWWIARVAARLERELVCPAKDYIELARQPEKFRDAVEFPLPTGSLEGYLFPDTYDLPPLLGAEKVIRMQLKAFEAKVVRRAPKGADLHKAVVVGSLVELEAARPDERPVVAGVIQNRIKKNMTLDLDASVLYALQEWKVLGPGVVRTVKSPYNTYLNRGLPPGPIGSPSWSSIQGALQPKAHDKLFYVARPDRTHIFSATYEDHKKAIVRARGEWRRARLAAGKSLDGVAPSQGGRPAR